MTENIALDYVKRRMQELGYGDNYHMQFRNLVVQSKDEFTIKAYNSYFILAEEPAEVQVRSMQGIFDLQLTNVTEMKYEFHGLIYIKNTGNRATNVRFIQVTPFKK